MTAIELVILVDEHDNPIGTAEKLQAHRDNLCHRAFSVFIFRSASLVNNKQELKVLLQQRAAGKYHSPLLWTNTCCSHPRPGEDITHAGQRRLKEEMGIDVAVEPIGRFHYIAHFNNGLVENEVDHVLVGYYENDTINPNPNEVHAYRWVTLGDLAKELAANPEQFTPWLAKALEIVNANLDSIKFGSQN